MQADRLRRLLAHLDLTRLEDGDTDREIEALCRHAVTPHGRPAAVCVLPDKVGTADRSLVGAGVRDRIRVATVANFPSGDGDIDEVLATIERALAAGADEIDLVLPWRAIRDGRPESARNMLAAARGRCGRATLKVILETGALGEPLIDAAAALAIDCGADFLKTSTGRGPPGASIEAASIVLDRIDRDDVAARCGLKVSGGIRTIESADRFLGLAEYRMGPAWPTPARFRIGASGLFDQLLDALDVEAKDLEARDLGAPDNAG